ncbi:hypothetical protein [Microbulbifer sp. Q7]|uniref:hypothetical protein n=1 Tax=Microbulbifer sp. Q7 TaxID=1785091 RepID=UPI000837A5D1|nr:hypothetical protein [Microbulbifer sp. Q7]
MDSSNIEQRVEIQGLEIIRRYPSDDALSSYPREKLNRNIEAYKAGGELAWIIQECPAGGQSEDKAYMDIQIKDGQLIAGNWIGLDFVVNLETGNVSPAKRGVRPW